MRGESSVGVGGGRVAAGEHGARREGFVGFAGVAPYCVIDCLVDGGLRGLPFRWDFGAFFGHSFGVWGWVFGGLRFVGELEEFVAQSASVLRSFGAACCALHELFKGIRFGVDGSGEDGDSKEVIQLEVIGRFGTCCGRR